MAPRRKVGRAGWERGQVLVFAAIAMAVLGVIASAMVAAWVHSAALAQRRAHHTTALYSAEAGLAAGLERILEGDEEFLAGHEEVGGTAGRGAYRVRVERSSSASSSKVTLVSTGWSRARADLQRTVRLVLDSPFFRPAVAKENLTLESSCWDRDDVERILEFLNRFGFEIPDTVFCGNERWTFEPHALYGNTVTANEPASGVTQGTVRLPVLTYAALAKRVPRDGPEVPLSARDCQITSSGWYEVHNNCHSLTVTAPWAGIVGKEPEIELDELTVSRDSVLVVDRTIKVKDFKWVNAQAVGGGGVIASGGMVEINNIDFVSRGVGGPVTVLALDTNTPDCTPGLPGCSFKPNAPNKATDLSNTIVIKRITAVTGPMEAAMVAYAAPFRIAPDGKVPTVEIGTESVISVGEISFRGALVSGGDLIVRDHTLVPLGKWHFRADPSVAGPLLRLSVDVPGSGLLTQISWSEEGEVAR